MSYKTRWTMWCPPCRLHYWLDHPPARLTPPGTEIRLVDRCPRCLTMGEERPDMAMADATTAGVSASSLRW